MGEYFKEWRPMGFLHEFMLLFCWSNQLIKSWVITMKKLLFFLCIFQVLSPGFLSAMEKKKNERCCYGGVIACVRRNITTPLWFNWHYERLIKELSQAVAADNGQKVTEIIGYGINPNGYREWGYTRDKFLEPALKNGKSNAATALLNAGAMPTLEELTCAFDHVASQKVRNLMLTKYLAIRGCEKNSALGMVMQKGTEGEIAFVLKNGASLNDKSVTDRRYERFTPLLYAVLKRPDIVPFLLGQGAEVTNQSIAQAIKSGDRALFDMLIRRHSFIIKGMQARSKKKKTFEQVFTLLLQAEKAQKQDEWHQKDETFHKALKDAPAHMIRHLCSLGVDPNWQDGEGRTALFYVDEAEKVRALLECGARPDIQDAQGKTVAHMLSIKSSADPKYYKALKTLLSHPRLMRSKEISDKAQRAVFVALCSLRRVCPTLPIDIRIRILLYAFRNEYYSGQWGKFMRNIPMSEVVRNVPLEAQLQLIEKRELSPLCYGSILDKEKLIVAHTECHMSHLIDLLFMCDNEGKVPCKYAQGTLREHLSVSSLPHFVYTWRGRIEREYRFLFDTSTLYTRHKKKIK